MSLAVQRPPDDPKAITNTFLTNWWTILTAPASSVAPPATSASAGIAGQIAFDSGFFYICIQSNSPTQAAIWKRIALVSF